MDLTLVREVVQPNIVKWAMPAPGIAYIRITEFNETTLSMLVESIGAAQASNNGPLSGLVLDLRKNTGGLLTVCVGTATAFLPKGVLVASTAGRDPDSNMQLYSRPEYYVRGSGDDPLKLLPPGVKWMPMVALVNSATVSGAEIVAAALQDHRRARLMGQRTSGFDVIHTIFPLADGTALKLASARFYRANGKPVGSGVDPDIALPAPADTVPYPISRIGQDPEVRAALKNLAAVSVSN